MTYFFFSFVIPNVDKGQCQIYKRRIEMEKLISIIEKTLVPVANKLSQTNI